MLPRLVSPAPIPRLAPALLAFLLLFLFLFLGPPFAACAVDTDLTNIPAAGGPDGALGPGGAALVDPAPGSADVPVNLAAVVVRFPSGVTWGPGGVRVCDGPGGAVPAASPIEVPCDRGSCYRVALAGRLPAGAPCTVSLPAGTRDAGGAPVGSGVIGIFDAAAAADVTPPVLAELTVAAAGPCLTVRFVTDEPAAGTALVSINGGGQDGEGDDAEIAVPAGLGLTRFDVALPFSGLPASVPATVTVTAVDRAGNAASSSPQPFETPGPLPPLVITEVLANPRGPEPAQEYVEVRNAGDVELSLAGLRLEDEKGGDDLPVTRVPAGGYALIVPSGYDALEGQDPAPRAGTVVARVDARLGADGLSNAGEVVRLRAADTVVSSYGGWVATSASAWAGHAVHRLIQGACDRPESWNRAPLAPTPGGAPP